MDISIQTHEYIDKEEQDKLKIELTHKLIEQEDWLVHDKNEIDTIKDVVKLLENKVSAQ